VHKTMLSFTALLLSGTMAVAQQMPAPANADDMKWGAAPNVFPPGAQIAVVSGDPFKEGLYVVRLKMPAGYKIPAHNHPTTEYVTVLTGAFNIGMGDKLDEKKRHGVAARRICRGGGQDEPLCLDFGRDRRPGPRSRTLRHHLRQSRGRPEQEIARPLEHATPS